MVNIRAFTKKGGSTLFEIRTPCGVSLPDDTSKNDELSEGGVKWFTGLWDTGATGSVVSKVVVEKLGLKPISNARVFHVNGESIVNVYLIDLFLPNQMGVQFVKVTEGILTGFDVLIGMDIITHGDFSITNVDGKTTFSFRIPSIKEVDYVQEGNS